MDDLLRQARNAADRKDWRTALEAATRAVASAAPGDALDRAREEESRIRSLMPGAAPGGAPAGGTKPPSPAEKKPAGPGKPPEAPPEKKPAAPSRDDEASELFRSSREAMEAGRIGDAERGFYRLLAEHGEAKIVRDYGVEVRQRLADALKKGRGVAGLFHGGLQFKGNRAVLTYEFEDPAEAGDWETVATFAVPQKGVFRVEGGELVGEGAASFMTRACFRSESVTMSFRIRPGIPARDMGAMMAEPRDLANHLLFTIGNEYFKLGKGSGAYAQPGNVIFVFGKGMWRDTDAGMVGFVRTAFADDPRVPPRKWSEVEVVKDKDKARFTIEGRALNGRSVGDNRYEITGVRAALFVLLSDAAFDEVTVEGELDPEWVRAERERVFPEPR